MKKIPGINIEVTQVPAQIDSKGAAQRSARCLLGLLNSAILSKNFSNEHAQLPTELVQAALNNGHLIKCGVRGCKTSLKLSGRSEDDNLEITRVNKMDSCHR